MQGAYKFSQFFISPPLLLGRSIFELVRRRYWQVEASFESVAQTVRLAYLFHFSSRALSALYAMPAYNEMRNHYTPEFIAQIRLMIFGAYAESNDGNVTLNDVPSALFALADNDGAAYDTISVYRQALEAHVMRRINMLYAVRTLLEYTDIPPPHVKQLSWSGFVAAALEIEPPFSDWNSGRASLYVQTPTTPSSSHHTVLLRHAITLVPSERIPAFVSAMLTYMKTDLPADHTSLTQIGNWLVEEYSAVRNSAPTSLGASIWTYDFADPLSVMLEGAARAGVLLALDAPSETIASMYATMNQPSGQRELDAHADWPELLDGNSDIQFMRNIHAQLDSCDIPDVCRLYQLYRDTSRFINLADWFDAFVYTIERAERKEPPSKRPKSESRIRDLQLRFALGINELAYMGLLGPTGRKVDHLLRTVWDITVDPLPESK